VEATWHRVEGALAAVPGTVKVERVAPGSFPPPDLVWFDGNLDNPAYRNQALGMNAQGEARAREAGLPPGWYAPDSDRILPLVWAPWAWWPASATSPATAEDRAALARVEEESSGPSLENGTGTADQPKTLVDGQGRVWASSLVIGSRTAEPQPAPIVPARVRGFWWNSEGWNRTRTAELLSVLWSPPVQRAATEPGWWPVASPVALNSAKRILLLP
jgi:hypothetical protein